MISDDINKKNALKKSLLDGLGRERWIGTYDFKEDHCVCYLRLTPSPGETDHLFDIISDSFYGDANEFDWADLATSPPNSVPGTDCSEEDDNAGGGKGITDIFFAMTEDPPLEWVQRLANKYPQLDVVLDYSWQSKELLGRVWFSGGKIYKQAHLTDFPAISAIASLEQQKNGIGRARLTVVSDLSNS